ncbi:hypothetical protein PINS_up018091 [Pythium insidiosum]|nr:hypothetical protein PINS_up007371 [Pythium insidiosum]GLE07538.1 hypothetical protein PINS_up018091 [Pythium insidiosum]
MWAIQVFATLAALVAGTAIDAVVAKPLHAGLNYHRYLEEREQTRAEVEEYLKSSAFKYASENGIWARDQEARDGEPTEDEMQRFHMAKDAIKDLERSNPDAEFSTDSPFTFLTVEEFSKKMTPAGLNATVMSAPPADTPVSPHQREPTKDCKFEVDWKAKGCISPIKNQGQCGSCWAFAAIAAIESAQCVKGMPLRQYSEQQLMSCDRKNKGCQGGSPTLAMDYVKNNGLCAETDAPYKGSESCPTCSPVQISIQSLRQLEQKDTALANAVRKQPVTVLVASGNNAWKQYKGGILSTCETTRLDHAVLVYGFSADSYLVKNSWGTWWGEKGFLRMRRNPEGMGTCNMYQSMMYPEL